MRHLCKRGCVILGAAIFLTACDSVQIEKQVQQQWNSLVSIVLGNNKPVGMNSPTPSGSPSPSGGLTDEEFSSAAARKAKANSEFLHEMLQVVFMREPKDRAEFGNWVDTLNQGASLEGVYNGLTHSSDYRKMEEIHTGAAAEAVRVFAEELALLEVELPAPTEFDSTSASPLPVLGNPDSGTSEIDFTRKAAPSADGSPSPSPQPEPRLLAAKYLSQFIGASIYTLKRISGDEALKVISAKSVYREKLATWYSKWAVRIIQQRNVDFGIPLRNKADEAFHFKWAMESTDDLVKWEVLNRIHRVLNEANRQKQ